MFGPVLTLTNPLIFDSNVNHENFEEADADWFIFVARAEPRKTGIRQTTKATDNTAVSR